MKVLLLFSSLLMILITIPSASSVMKFILDEKIEICSEKHFIDISKMQFIMVNDTTTVANGSTETLMEVKSPWKLGFYGEQFERGSWFKKFERKFDDFCKNVLKPTEIWYDAFYKKTNGKGCPYPNGLITLIDNEAVYFDVSFMPWTFQGRWRFTIVGDLGCFRVHYDFVDM